MTSGFRTVDEFCGTVKEGSFSSSCSSGVAAAVEQLSRKELLWIWINIFGGFSVVAALCCEVGFSMYRREELSLLPEDQNLDVTVMGAWTCVKFS